MARWQIALLGIFALGGLALTNPDRAAYETYALEQIGNLAKDKCDNDPGGLGILAQGPCRAAVATYLPQLRPLLSATTSRQNLLLFSIYRSDISVPVANFNTRIESIGIFNRFFTYKTP